LLGTPELATKRDTLSWGMPRQDREPPSSGSGARRKNAVAGKTLRPPLAAEPPKRRTKAPPTKPPETIATAETQEMPAVHAVDTVDVGVPEAPPAPAPHPATPPPGSRRGSDAGVYRFVAPPSDRRRKR
jgi:hypothetical protein